MKWLIDNQENSNLDSVGTISNSRSRLFFHRCRKEEDAPEYTYIYDSVFDLLTNSVEPEFCYKWSRRTEAVLLRYLNEHFSNGYEHGGLRGVTIL